MRKIASAKNYSSVTEGLTISPSAVSNVEIIRVSGAARTNSVLIDPSQLENGDSVAVLILFSDPSVPGITLELWTTTAQSSLLASVTSDGIQPNALFRFAADGCGGLQLLERLVPAFLS